MEKFIQKVFAVLAVLSLACSAPALTTNDFAKSVTFVTSGYAGSASLAGFPVLVKLSTALDGFSYSDFKAQSTGADLRFADADGNELPFEIDTWNPSGTSLVWVRLPTLSSTTRFTAYYGNANPGVAPASSGVWTAYSGVWHLNDADAPLVSADASGNGHEGTNATTTARIADGAVGACRQISDGGRFDTGSGILVTNPPPASGVYTISGWLRHKNQQPGNNESVFSQKNGAAGVAVGSFGVTYGPTGNWQIRAYGSTASAYGASLPGTWSDRAWAYVTASYGAKAGSCYTNGAYAINIYQQNTTNLASTCPLAFGTLSSGSGVNLKGELDEIRTSSSERSADWIKAEYDTVASDTFIEKYEGEKPVYPILGDPTANLLSDKPVLSVPLTKIGNAATTVTCHLGMSAETATDLASWTDITTNGGVYSVAAPGLVGGTTYYYWFTASCLFEGTPLLTSTVTNTFVAPCTLVWTGNAGTDDWTTPGNWDLGFAPSAGADVIIPSHSTINIAAGLAAVARSVTTDGPGSSLALGAGTTLAVGNNFMLGTNETGTASSFTLSGGAVTIGGTFIPCHKSLATTVTVEKVSINAASMAAADGSRLSALVIATGSVVNVSGTAEIGTSASAATNAVIVAAGGVFVADTIYISSGTDTVENRLIVDGGIVTNRVMAIANATGATAWCDVLNGGQFIDTASSVGVDLTVLGKGSSAGLTFGSGASYFATATAGLVLKSAITGFAAPFITVSNATVKALQLTMNAGSVFDVIGDSQITLGYGASYGRFTLGSDTTLGFTTGDAAWTNAPMVCRSFAESSGSKSNVVLNVDCSSLYVKGAKTFSIPLIALSATNTIPAYLTNNITATFPSRSWTWVPRLEDQLLSIEVTSPPTGFVIRICDNVPSVPSQWVF